VRYNQTAPMAQYSSITKDETRPVHNGRSSSQLLSFCLHPGQGGTWHTRSDVNAQSWGLHCCCSTNLSLQAAASNDNEP